MAAADAELAAISAKADQAAKVEAYKALVDATMTAADRVDRLKRIAEHALTDSVVGTVGRPVCEHLAEQVAEKVQEFEELDPLGEALVAIFRPHGQPLAKADFAVRNAMFNCYAANDEFEAAATIMNGCIAIPADQQVEMLLQVAQCYVSADDANSADLALRRVADLMGRSEEEASQANRLRYRACKAQVADQQRKYEQAAALYASLSELEGDVVQSELEDFLERAATCAILDRAGPQRQRLLAKIYRDPRAEKLPSFTMLEKMCRERLISRSEAEAFRAGLQEHHLAKTGDGTTVFDRAVREHNILAASRVYTNITFERLGDLLGIDAASAEVAAARMVEENRLSATIDQLNGIVDFSSGDADELAGWDASLKDLFAAVTDAVEAVSAKHPSMAVQ